MFSFKTHRLRKERLRLEKQSKLLAQLPTKKERNELEELKKKIADITSHYAKKESVQNMTVRIISYCKDNPDCNIILRIVLLCNHNE